MYVCFVQNMLENARNLLLHEVSNVRCTGLHTNSKEVSLSDAVSQNLKVHYRVHKSLPLVRILSQINSIHTVSYYLISILILSSQLRINLPSCPFPLVFPPKSHIHTSPPPCVPHYLPRFILLDLIILIILGDVYKL
jgi:hypothetical protein